jgi:hypothetical protein
LLRQQLIILKRQLKRPQLTNPERFRLVFLSHFTKFWKQALHIVQPETLLRWHQNLFRMYWRQKSQGRPKVDSETIVLIQKMANENLLWGAEQIRGELLKLGIEVSKRRVQPQSMVDNSTGSDRARFFAKPVLATWFIRLELSGKRGLSFYFTLIIFREHQNGQNP